MSGEKQTGAIRKRAGAIAHGLLLLAALGGAVPLLGQITPLSAGKAGDWTWMSGSSSTSASGVYGTLGTANGTTNVPGGREGATGWVDNSGNLWLLGGFGFAGNGIFGDLNDLWEFNPSTNYWTWMGGSNTLANNYCAASPTFGLPGNFGVGYVPGGRQSAASWTDKSGNLWLFGGDGVGAGTANACGTYSVGYLNDLWEFKPSLGAFGEWAWMGGSSTPNASGVYPAAMYEYTSGVAPGAREFAATWTDSSGDFWLFGGFGYDANGYFGELNDLWQFNPSLNEWAWMGGSSSVPAYSGQPGVYGTQGTPAATNIPGGRYGASTWADSSGNLWLYGGLGVDGVGNSGNLNDLWEFNRSVGEYGEWVWMGGNSAIGGGWPGVYGTEGTPAAENIPGGRDEAVSWIDSSGHYWLFGGAGFFNDLWAFDPSTSQWVWMDGSSTPNQFGSYGTLQSPASTNTPGGRYEATNWTDKDGNLWLFGGSGRAGGGAVDPLNDLWVYPPPPISFGGTAAATPVFSVASGTYTTTQTVSITDATVGATIYYTANGTTPTTSSNVFNSGNPITVSSTESLEAIATAPGDATSAVGTAVYTITPPAATPTFSPVAGTYPSTQMVTISDTTPGAMTFYTTNGTTPSFSGTVPNPGTSIYSGQITVSSTETIEAVATANGYSASAVGTAVYTIGAPAPAQVTDNETITVTDTETFPDVVDSEKITVTDSEVVRAYNAINITPTPAAFNPSSGNGYATHTYSAQFAATGGIGTLALTETGALPTGITFVNGLLSGTPAVSSVGNTYTFSVTAADADGDSITMPGYSLTIYAASAYPAMVMDNETITVADTETFPDVADSERITVADSEIVRAYNAIVITPSPASFNTSSGHGYAAHAYSVQFAATGGIGTLTLTESGALPTGIMFVNGLLSGTPAASSVGNTYTLSVTATDADGDSITVPGYSLTILAASAYPAQVTDIETITVTDTETFPDVVDSETITVTDTETVKTGPIITTTSPLPAGYVGVPYSSTLAASGGSGTNYTWSITSGGPALLARGLSLSNAGVLSGIPTAAATYPITVQVADSAGNTFSANFSVTVTVLAPIANLSPTMLTFAPQTMGTKSAAQTVTLSNTGNAPLSITGAGISISGANATDFSQTNACGMNVAVSGNCTISVTFTPSLSTGAETATLNVMDNASGSPQQVQLLGNALPTPSVSCAIPTVTVSGNTATAQITCTATNYTGMIALACNLPSQFSAYTCSFNPSGLNFTSTTTQASTTLTIQYQNASLERKSRPGTSGLVAFGTVFWLPAWVFVVRRKKAKSKRGVLLLLILFCGSLMTTSCGGKSGPPTAPPGTYQASVTLTGPGLNETISFTIQVQ